MCEYVYKGFSGLCRTREVCVPVHALKEAQWVLLVCFKHVCRMNGVVFVLGKSARTRTIPD